MGRSDALLEHLFGLLKPSDSTTVLKQQIELSLQVASALAKQAHLVAIAESMMLL